MNEANNNWKSLKEVEARVLLRLVRRDLVHKIHFIPINEKLLEVYVFYPTDKDIGEHAISGLTEKIKSIFSDELERAKRGEAYGEKVRYEFDSHENVLNKYEGNYFFRLR